MLNESPGVKRTVKDQREADRRLALEEQRRADIRERVEAVAAKVREQTKCG
jgi:hypothetical protein